MVKRADVLANTLFKETLEVLLTNSGRRSKMVQIDQELLLARAVEKFSH